MRRGWVLPVLAAAVVAAVAWATCSGPAEAPPPGGDGVPTARTEGAKSPRVPRKRADAYAPTSDGEETAPQPETSAEDAQDASRPERPATKDDGLLRSASGVVVDRATGKPIAGARMLLCFISDKDPHAAHWYGDRTSASGRFKASFGDGDELSGGRLEVRVRAPGYQVVRRAPEAGEMRIELDAWDTPPRAGRVVGVVTDEKGVACPGRLLVECNDEFGDHAAQWTWADAGGAFVLEGLPAGWWQLRGDGELATSRREVVVPDGGETRVHLVVDPTPTDPKHLAALEAATAQLEQIGRELDDLSKAPEAERKRRAEERERLHEGVAALSARTTKGREVRIAGLPTDFAGTIVRLTPSAQRSWFWRARVDGTTARFDDVPEGAYVLRAETPTGMPVIRRFEVPTGTGAVEVDLAAAVK